MIDLKVKFMPQGKYSSTPASETIFFHISPLLLDASYLVHMVKKLMRAREQPTELLLGSQIMQINKNHMLWVIAFV